MLRSSEVFHLMERAKEFGLAAEKISYDLDAVTLVDLQASYALTEDLGLSVNVSNVFDEAYVANCGSFGCYYGDGRTVQARLTWKW